ncbi:DUF2927 domain-containing protein [Pseudaestuariivita atlantica]|uniref:ATP-dependent transcriptional regulator n=1 Tax=Pseudaestuariivita atlantica TaxID=1317121 RepID=A0A0L1JUM3_9RHOB|nr:DUF2927 domain-containing protein [Pseudaestuariivita atlantica]KNG95469.1 ATP-dependent transcriptional regulator [Pseudaestuariivita atlantica]
MRQYRRFILPLYLLLGACMPVTPAEVPSRAATTATGLPPIKTFAVPRPVPAQRSNTDIARDFLELSFKLESGRDIPVFTRFEGPITVRVTGAPSSNLQSDLNRLLHRLRAEARIDISQTATGPANVTIESVSRADIRRALPMAACFVVPNVSSLAEYRRARRSPAVNWLRLRKREKIAIFVPNDAPPQEVRDCLHEELAQALGPLNDLYRLPDSVFNDDNVHTVLTGFDMLILRAYYDPALRNGMTRREAALKIRDILARINPQGANRPSHRLERTPRLWIEAVQTALGPGAKSAQRRRAAAEALQIAAAMGWQDHRRAFSHYAMGRLNQLSDPKAAEAEFRKANAYYARSNDTSLHRAYVTSQLAAFAISSNEPRTALEMLGPSIQIAARHENAALLATLMMLQAEALDLEGRASEAQRIRMDSLGWARYGFGPEWAVRSKLREISALNPLKRPRL